MRVRISTVILDRSPMRATKWALLIALVFAGISCNADRAKLLFKNDGGGDIPQYIAKYLYLQLSGERVVSSPAIASLLVRWRLVCWRRTGDALPTKHGSARPG